MRLLPNKATRIRKFNKILQFGPDRIYGLDILRAMAILFVMIEHGKFLLPVREFPNKFFFIFKLSLDGVSIFFVLSGFLIGGIIIRLLEREKAGRFILLNFWVKRWFRTLPNYYLILIITIIFYASSSSFNWQAYYYKYFFFVQSFVTPHPDFFNEAWSLCVEEWFYLIVPSFIFTLVIILKFKPNFSVLITALVFLLIPTLFRLYRFNEIGFISETNWDLMYRKQVITRLDSIMFGIIGAYLSYYHSLIWQKIPKICFLAGIIILCGERIIEQFFLSRWPIYSCVFSFTMNGIGTLLVLPLLSSLKKGKGIVYRLLTFISLISYSMYLLNL